MTHYLTTALDSAIGSGVGLLLGGTAATAVSRWRARRRTCSVDRIATVGWVVRHAAGCPCRIDAATLDAAQQRTQHPAPSGPA